MDNTAVIGFIGGGNMATSLIGGLVADGYPPENIWVADLHQAKLDLLKKHFGVQVTTEAGEVVKQSSAVILAVKPQVLKSVTQSLSDEIQLYKPLVISVAAGVKIEAIRNWCGSPLIPVVRCMPNTPAIVQTGATALCAANNVSNDQKETAECILRAVGITTWIDDEADIDAITAVSGSGPAYFFLIMEAMEAAAVELGLEADKARLLIQQTMLGAAKMALESEHTPGELRSHVTSPGGTTEQAIKSMQADNLNELMARAMRAACNRSRELSQQLGGTD